MHHDYFLFGIALIWTAFASIQDLKTREVANWLSFSLIFFGLFYKLFYSLWSGQVEYITAGGLSFLLFTGIAYIFYYGKIFAGGDAKLLMGMGAIIPGILPGEIVINGLLFVFVLLFIGAIWSIIALFTPLVPIDKKIFHIEFGKYKKYYVYLNSISLLVVLFSFYTLNFVPALIVSIVFTLIILGYPLLKSADKSMTIILPASKLTEGDWIIDDIIVRGKTIRKTIHGLSKEDIVLLEKYGKRVEVKSGVPFIPAFFFTLLFMVFFWASEQSLTLLIARLVQLS